ncbi:MAG TPA: universal stress protein [Anaerolineales bacterium]|jgi:nucleotide-binding universal stress UspA family protein|nr:universal stress protein [Anaerolineales bacterium]
MINHILVPLDGSSLAECVLPHVLAIAPVTNARVTLIHVLEHPEHQNGNAPIDLMGWHMHKQEVQAYLENTTERLQKSGLEVSQVILEGKSAESIIDFARGNDVDLIALSTHGRTGLTGWNVSSVVQKVLLRAYRSILLARAYASSPEEKVTYKRLFLGSDGSARAEFMLPVAISLAQYHESEIVIGTVIQKPQIIQRMPLSEKDAKLINQLTEKNQKIATRYHEQITTQLALKGLNVKSTVAVAEHTIGALHDMVEELKADLVILVAHGETGERRWPYGSIATSFIAQGSTPLIILQDLSENDVLPTHAEQAIHQGRGH